MSGNETVALTPATPARLAIARQHYLEGWAWAAKGVEALGKWTTYPGDTHTALDSLRMHMINASLTRWEHDGSFAQGMEAGYYAALGQDVDAR